MPAHSLAAIIIAVSAGAAISVQVAAASADSVSGSCDVPMLAWDIVAGAVAVSAPVPADRETSDAAPDSSGTGIGPQAPESAPIRSAPSSLVAAAVPVTAGGGCMAAEESDVVLAGSIQTAMIVSDASASNPAEAPVLELELAVADRQAEAEAPVVAVERAIASTVKPPSRKVAVPAPIVPATAWWPAKSDGRFNLTYAGDATFTRAIVLLFDGAFADPDTANRNIRVSSVAGEPVKGQWVVATNKQMLLFKAESGQYVVEIGEGLKDGNGRRIAAAAQGSVLVP